AARAGAAALEALLKDLARWAEARQKAIVAPGPAGEFAPPLLEWIAATLKAAKVRADGTTAIATAEVDLTEVVARVMSAVPDSVFTARSGTPGENNLRQIILALH